MACVVLSIDSDAHKCEEEVKKEHMHMEHRTWDKGFRFYSFSSEFRINREKKKYMHYAHMHKLILC